MVHEKNLPLTLTQEQAMVFIILKIYITNININKYMHILIKLAIKQLFYINFKFIFLPIVIIGYCTKCIVNVTVVP